MYGFPVECIPLECKVHFFDSSYAIYVVMVLLHFVLKMTSSCADSLMSNNVQWILQPAKVIPDGTQHSKRQHEHGVTIRV